MEEKKLESEASPVLQKKIKERVEERREKAKNLSLPPHPSLRFFCFNFDFNRKKIHGQNVILQSLLSARSTFEKGEREREKVERGGNVGGEGRKCV